MKLLFIQGGTRIKKDEEGRWYSDSNFNNSIFFRYRDICDELTVILRREEKIYRHSYAESHFNLIDERIVRLVDVPDCMHPRRNCLDFGLLKEIWNTIDKEVKNSDRVIIRSVLTYYTIVAARLCEKYGKRYLIEVTGYALDGYITMGLPGFIVALPAEIIMKHYIKKAPYVLYVTEWKMQKRYPTKGVNIGCSDVEIPGKPVRGGKAAGRKNKLLIGTAAHIDLEAKGQKYVLKALYLLKKQGITDIEYQMAGKGDKEKLAHIARKYGVEKQVKFCGVYPKSQVWEWLSGLDIYIQPSLTEGLCRSIVEAMGAGCPVIATDVGGNGELVGKRYLVKARNAGQIAEKINKLRNPELRKKESERNYRKSLKYRSYILDGKRKEFLERFMYED